MRAGRRPRIAVGEVCEQDPREALHGPVALFDSAAAALRHRRGVLGPGPQITHPVDIILHRILGVALDGSARLAEPPDEGREHCDRGGIFSDLNLCAGNQQAAEGVIRGDELPE